MAVGADGGIIGGFSAFPGSITVVYLGLRGVSKAETRGITITAYASGHDPALAAKPSREASAPPAAKFWLLVTLALGLWWAIWLAVRSVASAFAM